MVNSESVQKMESRLHPCRADAIKMHLLMQPWQYFLNSGSCLLPAKERLVIIILTTSLLFQHTYNIYFLHVRGKPGALLSFNPSKSWHNKIESFEILICPICGFFCIFIIPFEIFLGWWGILVCSSCCKKNIPQTGQLKDNRNLILPVLEAGSLRSGCQRGRWGSLPGA